MSFTAPNEATFDHRRMIRFVSRLCDLLLGDGAGEYWFWEMTPLPCGFPSLEQYREGMEWALKMKEELTPDELRQIHYQGVVE